MSTIIYMNGWAGLMMGFDMAGYWFGMNIHISWTILDYPKHTYHKDKGRYIGIWRGKLCYIKNT